MNTSQAALQHAKTLLRSEIKALFLNDKDDEAFSKMVSLSILDGVLYSLDDDLEERVVAIESGLASIGEAAGKANELLKGQITLNTDKKIKKNMKKVEKGIKKSKKLSRKVKL